jgi:hypothetical protein
MQISKQTDSTIELKGQKEYIGYIGIVDFLTQLNIDNSDIRSTLDSTVLESKDIVSEFINDEEIVDYLHNKGNITDVTVTKYGFTKIAEFNTEKLRLESLGVTWSNPDDVRKLLSSYYSPTPKNSHNSKHLNSQSRFYILI